MKISMTKCFWFCRSYWMKEFRKVKKVWENTFEHRSSFSSHKLTDAVQKNRLFSLHRKVKNIKFHSKRIQLKPSFQEKF